MSEGEREMMVLTVVQRDKTSTLIRACSTSLASTSLEPWQDQEAVINEVLLVLGCRYVIARPHACLPKLSNSCSALAARSDSTRATVYGFSD